MLGPGIEMGRLFWPGRRQNLWRDAVRPSAELPQVAIPRSQLRAVHPQSLRPESLQQRQTPRQPARARSGQVDPPAIWAVRALRRYRTGTGSGGVRVVSQECRGMIARLFRVVLVGWVESLRGPPRWQSRWAS